MQLWKRHSLEDGGEGWDWRGQRTHGDVESVGSFVGGFGAVDEDVDGGVEIRPRVERAAAELNQKRRGEEHPSVEGDGLPVEKQILLSLFLGRRFHNGIHGPVVHEHAHQNVSGLFLILVYYDTHLHRRSQHNGVRRKQTWINLQGRELTASRL